MKFLVIIKNIILFIKISQKKLLLMILALMILILILLVNKYINTSKCLLKQLKFLLTTYSPGTNIITKGIYSTRILKISKLHKMEK
ncbi:uncharacterized protein ASCRUDRAFT_151070 [Ascoidea rubescens DSM 1968]|uniref:Uncharacterized protein n=1 Tax=Ascoidea rubescens DSM 1968 TaxID=1344418 RepID=A0A1D2VH11_9ASCO|nr:hypothetical protein ASCRUDRAFT_151070 [Ascoidea rubescens DSM 1968]ODV60889.1 hypothetical protein ASCRUDRAFT_151070 [Ascoidea rubescens DSM 1968]